MRPGWLRILFAGVGGQGVLSAGRWVGDAAAGAGIDVVVGQIHGMSQRGGSVQASVVLSQEVPLGGDRRVVVAVRKAADGTLSTQVVPGPGVRPDAPEVAVRVRAVAAALADPAQQAVDHLAVQRTCPGRIGQTQGAVQR